LVQQKRTGRLWGKRVAGLKGGGGGGGKRGRRRREEGKGSNVDNESFKIKNAYFLIIPKSTSLKIKTQNMIINLIFSEHLRQADNTRFL